MEAQFDHIVLDSPPVLGFADSIILSTSVDGVILVVLGGKTPRETLQRAKEVLHQVNAKILGVVINRVDIHRSDYGYYYYRYHYYYGKEGKKGRENFPISSEEESVLNLRIFVFFHEKDFSFLFSLVLIVFIWQWVIISSPSGEESLSTR